MLHTARIIHVSIDRPWNEVYAYASNPENIKYWASGLASGLIWDGDDWVGDGGPIGKVRVRFAPQNGFGVLDHRVTLETGQVFDNPLRVVANGAGAEVMFTLFRAPDVDDATFQADAHHILKDLTALKERLEQD